MANCWTTESRGLSGRMSSEGEIHLHGGAPEFCNFLSASPDEEQKS